MRMKIGIDPTGGTDPWSGNIVWSGEQNPLDTWALLSVETVAKSNQVTVFTHSAPPWPTKHNDVYWDDASLVSTAPPRAADQHPASAAAYARAGDGHARFRRRRP